MQDMAVFITPGTTPQLPAEFHLKRGLPLAYLYIRPDEQPGSVVAQLTVGWKHISPVIAFHCRFNHHLFNLGPGIKFPEQGIAEGASPAVYVLADVGQPAGMRHKAHLTPVGVLPGSRAHHFIDHLIAFSFYTQPGGGLQFPFI